MDRIQSEYDVIFVISGTNTPDGMKHPDMKVGAPADSLNSLVVNSVDMSGKSASYSRRGPSGNVSDIMGYGVVPKHIEDILNTSDDEIKFIIIGTTEEYETYNYTLPVPVVNGKHPYYAKICKSRGRDKVRLEKLQCNTLYDDT